MKPYKLLTLIFLSTLFLQSCERLLTGRSNKNKVHGTVTDKETGEAIKDVKLTIYIEDFDRTNGEDEVTEHTAYTDDNGDYDLKFKREDGTHYYIKPTHDNYTLVILNGWYPNLENGLENEINFEMTKIGPAKINIVTYLINPVNSHDYSNRIPDVKITVLERHEEDNDTYPISVDTIKYTDNTGECYIEYWEKEAFHYFLKPEKEGYTYDKWGYDYYMLGSYTQGHPKNIELGMRQEK
ncbi:MAG: carboxypeptidase-like regulatory domain-containing protein [Bacteroidales bacterium]|nr:carboxypeptidase-like regulatory domain-containing protein [Bacteroidales bacterium]